MIPLQVVEEVRRLVAEGTLSLRKIARRVGVSRTTVGKIVSGRHVSFWLPRAEQANCVPTGPRRRCAQCGALVDLPCLACHVRAAWPGARRLRREPAAEPLELNLKPEHRLRYEQIRAQVAGMGAETEPIVSHRGRRK